MKAFLTTMIFVMVAFACRGLFASEFLPPGAGPVMLSGSTVALEADLAGTVIHDKLIPFRIASAAGVLLFQGVLQNRVVKNANGELHFYYRIRDTKAGLNGIIRSLTTISYAISPMLSVDWRPDGMGVINPKSAQRSAAPGPTIKFEFNVAPGAGPVLVGGTESKFFYLKTVRAANFDERGSTRIQLVTGQATVLNTAQPLR
jgi:hypothetical protein